LTANDRFLTRRAADPFSALSSRVVRRLLLASGNPP
jgi:hypothetical protein